MKKNLTILFLFVCFAVSAQQSVLDFDHIYGLDLSPDEQTIVITRPTWDKVEDAILYIVNVKSSKVDRLDLTKSPVYSAKFSPDGQRIVFHSDLGQVSSCDLQGKHIRKYNPSSNNLLINDICYSIDGQSVYFAADSIGEKPKMNRLYQLDIQSGKTEIIPGIEASDILGLNVCGDDLLFSMSFKKEVKEAKMIRLKLKDKNLIEEIIPVGNPKFFVFPKYHKASNQLIFCNNTGFYKMNMDTKEYKHFYNLEKGRRLMFYDIAQNEERLYFYEIGTRYIMVIDFEGKEISRIPLSHI